MEAWGALDLDTNLRRAYSDCALFAKRSGYDKLSLEEFSRNSFNLKDDFPEVGCKGADVKTIVLWLESLLQLSRFIFHSLISTEYCLIAQPLSRSLSLFPSIFLFGSLCRSLSPLLLSFTVSRSFVLALHWLKAYLVIKLPMFVCTLYELRPMHLIGSRKCILAMLGVSCMCCSAQIVVHHVLCYFRNVL